MKKLLILLLILASCMTVFAEGNSVKIAAVPYNLQIIKGSVSGLPSSVSKYGFGVDISYQRALKAGLYAEIGVNWSGNTLKDYEFMSDLLGYAGFGYKFNLSDNLVTFVHVDAGEDTPFYDTVASVVFALKGGAGLSYSTGDHVSFDFTCDAFCAFAEDTKASYTCFKLLPSIGATITF